MTKKLILPLMLVLALAMAGCGSSGSSSAGSAAQPSAQSTTHFAKTKFVLHAGLAFGVFHHFIYKPFKAGDLSHPLRHKLEFFKALAAGGFVYHEVKLALNDAKSSKILSRVVVPLAGMAIAVEGIRAALAHHQANSSAFNQANSDAASASSASKASGQPITETTSGSGI